MIKLSRTSQDNLRRAAEMVLSSASYAADVFPQQSRPDTLISELKESPESWNVILVQDPAAFFRLHLIADEAVIDRLLISGRAPPDAVIRGLRQDLEKMKIKSLTIDVPQDIAQHLTKDGFQTLGPKLRLSGPIVETKLMPILPLTNPRDEDIPGLANLMHESFQKSNERKPPNSVSAEKLLKNITDGALGRYLPDVSLISGTTTGNVVSACFVTLSSPQEANVTQLFTHPLYRARGLASTEVATSMNRLAKTNVQKLTVWIRASNEIAKRLFSKLGFRQDRELTEMRSDIGRDSGNC